MSEWFEGFFEGDWLDVKRSYHDLPGSEATAEALVSLLGLTPGDEVLDVPCGTGRISVPLARLGLPVTGVDFNETVLDHAQQAARQAGVPLALERRDMRDLPWRDRFAAAFNLWGSFGYFDDAGNEAFATAVCSSLAPGGRFVIDSPTWEWLLPKYQPRSWSFVGDIRVLESRAYDAHTGRMNVEWTFVRNGRETTRRSSMRLYTTYELVALMRRAGFSDTALYGDTKGEPFDIGKRLLLVATK